MHHDDPDGLRSLAVGPTVESRLDDGDMRLRLWVMIRTSNDDLAAHLKSQGVPTAIYYPIPIHMQDPYANYPVAPGGLPVTEEVRNRVLSLPMHPYLDAEQQDRVIEAIRGFNG